MSLHNTTALIDNSVEIQWGIFSFLFPSCALSVTLQRQDYVTKDKYQLKEYSFNKKKSHVVKSIIAFVREAHCSGAWLHLLQ
jgi:hypothetical protein